MSLSGSMISTGYPDLNHYLDGRGRLHIYLGPMGLVITAKKDDVSVFKDSILVKETIKKAVRTLEEVSSEKELVYRFVSEKHCPDDLPHVVKLMIHSSHRVSRISGEMLTPMASVAGSISETMLDFLNKRSDETIVNNYGDIAMKIRRAKIGLRDGKGEFYGTLILDEGEYGVCTSGFGGRSLTRGIADGVTCICESASFADACATVIANSVIVDSEKIKKVPAENVHPDTDIRGLDVVVHVGNLSESDIKKAIQNGIEMAEKLDVMAVIKLKNFIALRKIKKKRVEFREDLTLLYP